MKLRLSLPAETNGQRQPEPQSGDGVVSYPESVLIQMFLSN